MSDSDYCRFHNFLNGHGCKLDFREFRTGQGHLPRAAARLSRRRRRRRIPPPTRSPRDLILQVRDVSIRDTSGFRHSVLLVSLSSQLELEGMMQSRDRRNLFVVALIAALVVGMPRAAQSQDAALIAKGKQVYDAQKCQMCHSIAGKGGKQSPLDGVGSKLSADEIRQWIVDPVEMAKKVKSTKKPPMPKKYDKLPAGDLDALVAYMQSLKK
jgi:mono/diheme cytochrome c family protein